MDNVKVMIQKTKEGISNNILASMSSGTHILSFNVKSTSIGKHTQQPNTESSSLLIQDSQGMRQSQEPRIVAAMINSITNIKVNTKTGPIASLKREYCSYFFLCVHFLKQEQLKRETSSYLLKTYKASYN